MLVYTDNEWTSWWEWEWMEKNTEYVATNEHNGTSSWRVRTGLINILATMDDIDFELSFEIKLQRWLYVPDTCPKWAEQEGNRKYWLKHWGTENPFPLVKTINQPDQDSTEGLVVIHKDGTTIQF